MGVPNMRKAIMIAGLILALGVLAPAGALGKAGGTERPIKAHASGTTVFDNPTLTFVSDATGTMSHLGKTTAHFDGALTLTGPSAFDVAGSYVTVAANGDQLFATFAGSGTLDASGNATGTTTTTFTGGTGRFAGASGTATGPFSQVLTSTDGTTSTFAFDTSLRGTISY